MHELSMAQGIINAVIDTAEANDATKVTDMVIEIGRLAMLNPEQLKFMLGVLCQDTIAEDAKIVIENIDVEIKCANCDYEGVAYVDDSDHYAPMILCPKCESHRVKVFNGKDVTVKNISIEKEDEWFSLFKLISLLSISILVLKTIKIINRFYKNFILINELFN